MTLHTHKQESTQCGFFVIVHTIIDLIQPTMGTHTQYIYTQVLQALCNVWSIWTIILHNAFDIHNSSNYISKLLTNV